MKRQPRHTKNKLTVAVVGGSACSKKVEQISQNLGFLLGKMGAIVICGGLSGVMEAVSKGVSMSNGVCIGILPGSDKKAANPYITIALPTGLGFSRNTLVVGCSDIVIAMPGEHGTLSEVALALSMGKLVIGIGTWDINGVIKADTPKEAVDKIIQLSDSKKI